MESCDWAQMHTLDMQESADYLAPDGSEVRLLCQGRRGGLAHFSLAPGRVSVAIAHQSVEELWFVLSGQGEMWRCDSAGHEDVVVLRRGTSLALYAGTEFQFRARGTEPLEVLAATMPPWPGASEARLVEPHWSVG